MSKFLDMIVKRYSTQKQYRANLKSIKEFKQMMGQHSGGMEYSNVEGDTRYNEPKQSHKAPLSLIDETIENTDIYKRAKEHILNAQRGQVGYGLDKYPEPLNANTWSILESFDHTIDEAVDKLHYLVMARIQMETLMLELEELREFKKAHDGFYYADGKVYDISNAGTVKEATKHWD